MSKQALEGLKVADFSWYIAGPSISMWLAHHGAQVIRIESLTRPDELRGIEPFKDGIPGINRSGCYATYNSNKYGIALNLKHPKGVEVAKKIVAWADVAVEKTREGTLTFLEERLQEIERGLATLEAQKADLSGKIGSMRAQINDLVKKLRPG